MGNSSQSGNILGYASGTQPGLVSTVAQTFAGKKTLDGGALIKGDTSGNAIASGYVGEILGTERAGTNGKTYSFRSTTAAGNGSFSKVISTNVNKGFYLVWLSMSAYTSSSSEVAGYLTLGSTQVSNTIYAGSIGGIARGTICIVMPVLITADTTEIAGYLQTNASPSGNTHEMTIFRID